MFRRNVGGLDRAVRLAVGIVLLPAGLFLLDGAGGGIAGLVLATVGLVGLASGASGFCLLYVPLGFSTARHREAAASL
ncbi:MAG: DUF2892 domain-containing protein [Actinomycetota bacterium]